MSGPSVRVLILGATGGVGSQVLSQALAAGHEPTVLVRRPGRLLVAADRVRAIAGPVEDTNALHQAVAGQDAVISALGVGRSFSSNRLITRSAPLIVSAMLRHRVSRLIVVSAFGVGPTWGAVPALPRVMIRLLLRDIYRDKAAGEDLIRGTMLDWTLVHPTMLTNGPQTGRYAVGQDLALRGFPTVSRADVAHFLLTQIHDRTWSRASVLISSATG